jgi:hypothetical protein
MLARIVITAPNVTSLPVPAWSNRNQRKNFPGNLLSNRMRRTGPPSSQRLQSFCTVQSTPSPIATKQSAFNAVLVPRHTEHPTFDLVDLIKNHKPVSLLAIPFKLPKAGRANPFSFNKHNFRPHR